MSGPVLVLASSSVYRRQLLERLGLPFVVAAPAVDESPLPGEAPTGLVRRLAEAKARAVAAAHPDALIVGSDQIAVHDGLAVGKPAGFDEGFAQLRRASGRTVELYTGIALYNSGADRMQSDVVPFAVDFRTLCDDEIRNYLERDRPYDCCGSVRVEGLGIALLERLRGDDPSALIGLPLVRLCAMLRSEGVSPLAGRLFERR